MNGATMIGRTKRNCNSSVLHPLHVHDIVDVAVWVQIVVGNGAAELENRGHEVGNLTSGAHSTDG